MGRRTTAGENTRTGVRSRDSRVYRVVKPIFGDAAARMAARFEYLFRLGLLPQSRDFVGSVDITHRCNLECAHCYFRHQGYAWELSDSQWIEFFDRLRGTGFPFFQCSWVGGEPLLRWRLLEKLIGLFQANLVATNGTVDLPDWPDVNFYVSVDGTRGHYAELRGRGDLYDRIKRNVLASDRLKVRVGMVVTSRNHGCIEEFLAEWRDTPVRSVLFEFYTPVAQAPDELWPGWELRDRILRRLLNLKTRHGDFIENNEKTLRLMRSDLAGASTRKCLFSKLAFCFGPDGKPKRPCMMGPGADCTRCGCILPFHMGMMHDKGLLFREVAGLLGNMLGDGGHERAKGGAGR
ncbi:MAG: radical SAM protein [Planctomycetota bacterium]